MKPVPTAAPAAPPGAAAPRDPRAELRRASQQLEGVFLAQLFRAMRESVPQGGFVDAGEGERMFQSLLDDRVANLAAEHSVRGLGDAIYRQLSRRLQNPESTPKLEEW